MAVIVEGREMKTRGIVVAVLGMGLLWSGCAAPTADRPAPLAEWKPDVDGAIQQLEEKFDTLMQQQPMNGTSGAIAMVYDAKLYILFYDFVARLPESARGKELEEQRQWLAKREKLSAAAYAEYEGGTMAPLNRNQAFIEATRARILEVERKIKGTSNRAADPAR